MLKEYTGGAAIVTLSANIDNDDLSFTTNASNGWPNGATAPFVVSITTAGAVEKMLCASRSGNTFTVTTRGYDGTTAIAHTAGDQVKHVIDAASLTEFAGAVTAVAPLAAHIATTSQFHKYIGAGVFSGSNQAIASATLTAATFNQENFDSPAGWHDNVTNNTRLTVPAGYTGFYNIIYRGTFNGHATGFRYLALRLDGSNTIQYTQRTVVSAAGGEYMGGSIIYPLNAGQYMELMVYQTSGGSLDLIAGYSATSLQVAFIGT